MSDWNDGKRNTWRCCLCNKLGTGFGNNPQPLDSGERKCCDDCNRDKVVPERLSRMAQGRSIYGE